jgi:hypothetical protein
MSLSEKHSLAAAVLDTDVLGGCTQLQVTLGSEVDHETADGELYPQIVALKAQNPKATWQTRAVATALDLVGLAGVNIDDLTAGLLLYGLKRDGVGIAAGSVHRQYKAVNGVLVPTTMSVDHQGSCVLSYEATVGWDGTNDPWEVVDNVAAPSGATDVQRFSIGGITLGAIALTGFTQMQVNFGAKAVAEGADSDIWPTLVTVEEIKPVFSLTGRSVSTWFKDSAIPHVGKALTHANTSLYLRKRAAGGTWVSGVTAEHIKLTVAGMAVIDTAFDASGSGGGTCSIQVYAIDDGTNAPIVIDTTSALP